MFKCTAFDYQPCQNAIGCPLAFVPCCKFCKNPCDDRCLNNPIDCGMYVNETKVKIRGINK